eukprot:SAG31_NODE_30098_length_385_cov_1.020979_1_plen_63_part_10
MLGEAHRCGHAWDILKNMGTPERPYARRVRPHRIPILIWEHALSKHTRAVAANRVHLRGIYYL